jgi:phage N-6-adenine-methyltransferase
MEKKEQFLAKSIEYETPDEIFLPLDKEFGFTLDVCATAENAKCKMYFSKEDDALSKKWEGVCWMNPPFGRMMQKFVKKAHEEWKAGATVVMLIPVRSNTKLNDAEFKHCEKMAKNAGWILTRQDDNYQSTTYHLTKS